VVLFDGFKILFENVELYNYVEYHLLIYSTVPGHIKTLWACKMATAGGPAYYVLHPQKFAFFLTYQVFRNREGIISQKILTEGLQF